MKKTVYDVKTGDTIELEPVDARERLQAGLAVSVKPVPIEFVDDDFDDYIESANPVVKESLTTEIEFEQPAKAKK